MAGIYDEQILGAKQQAETARKLRESITAPQGQMVSGWYVAPSITQHLANALKTYQAAQDEKKAQETYDELTRTKAQQTADLLRQLQPRQVATPSPQEAIDMAGRQPMQMNNTQPLPQTQTAEIKPSDQERMAALLQGLNVNPEAFQGQLKAEEWNMARQDKQDALQAAENLKRELADANNKAELQRAREAQQGRIELARLAANLKGGQQDQGPKLNPTIEKEIFQADEMANTTQNALSMLQQARELNKQPTYSGYGAHARALARSNLPGESPEASNTINLDNIMTGQALESLKATFGGNPTEGERAILLDLQASSSKSPADREKIISRAIDLASQRLKFHGQKAEALRNGTYFNRSPIPAPIPNAAQTNGAAQSTVGKATVSNW